MKAVLDTFKKVNGRRVVMRCDYKFQKVNGRRVVMRCDYKFG